MKIIASIQNRQRDNNPLHNYIAAFAAAAATAVAAALHHYYAISYFIFTFCDFHFTLPFALDFLFADCSANNVQVRVNKTEYHLSDTFQTTANCFAFELWVFREFATLLNLANCK